MTGTLSREIISTRQEKIATLARHEPKLVLTTLAHHIDALWLREAYRRTRKDVADFMAVGESIARNLIGAGEYEQFETWFQEALTNSGQATMRAEYEHFKVTLSRQHLLLLFTRNQP